MPASTYASINGSLFELSADGQPPTKPSPSQLSPEIIVTIVFGLCAIGIGLATIWQSHKTWKTCHVDGARSASIQADLELGISQGSVTGPERDLSIASTSWTPPTPHNMETSSERRHHQVLSKEQFLPRPSGESLGSQQTLNDEPAFIAQPTSVNTDTILSSTMLYPPSGARPLIDKREKVDHSHIPPLGAVEE